MASIPPLELPIAWNRRAIKAFQRGDEARGFWFLDETIRRAMQRQLDKPWRGTGAEVIQIDIATECPDA